MSVIEPDGTVSNMNDVPYEPGTDESLQGTAYDPKSFAGLWGRNPLWQATPEAMRPATEAETEQHDQDRRTKNAKRKRERKTA